MIHAETIRLSGFGQGVPFPQALERAQFAVPILQQISVELRTQAGPQRLLTFPDLDETAPAVPTDMLEIDRTIFRQNRDALAIAIKEVNPAIDELQLRRQSAFPFVPPEVTADPQNVDTFTAQLDKLIEIFEEIVLKKKPRFKASPVVIIAGLVLGFLGFGTIVYLTQRS
ncbi:hypothetical protein LCGC14_2491470 [marine sediment metagenome]|uniref:Uncharacterized protein n=1 Tax=marine sediment metagenome TaxID=412755 RepID=A0A0F9DYC4_9ZZZZ